MPTILRADGSIYEVVLLVSVPVLPKTKRGGSSTIVGKSVVMVDNINPNNRLCADIIYRKATAPF